MGHLYSQSPMLFWSIKVFFLQFFAVFYKKFNGIISIKGTFSGIYKSASYGKSFQIAVISRDKVKALPPISDGAPD